MKIKELLIVTSKAVNDGHGDLDIDFAYVYHPGKGFIPEIVPFKAEPFTSVSTKKVNKEVKMPCGKKKGKGKGGRSKK